MNLAFKSKELREENERLAELSHTIREMVEANPDWKERPKEFMQKVLGKIDEIKPKFILPAETEKRFGLFMENELKQAALLPAPDPTIKLRILDSAPPTPHDAIITDMMNRDILVDVAIITRLITYANKESTEGLKKLLEKPDSEVKELVSRFEDDESARLKKQGAL
jgi:hypothetical protein